jgi:heavy metal sensor kinase
MRLFRTNLRTRLTVLYASILALVLLLYCAGSCALLLHNLREQLDIRIHREIETVESLLVMPSEGRIELQSRFSGSQRGGEAKEGYFVEVWSTDGQLLYRTPELGGHSLGPPPPPTDVARTDFEGSSRLADGLNVRIGRRSYQLGARPIVVRLALSEAGVWREFWQTASVLGLGLPVAVLLVAFIANTVAARALQPVALMAQRAEEIGADRLDDRLTIENPEDELGHLGMVINQMLGRLEASFEQLRRFTADASHELRTPLTAIRSVGEVALHKAGDSNYYRDVIGSMLEEANRLTALVDSLLILSRADAQRIPLQRAEVPLFDVAKQAAGLLSVLAEEKGQTLTVSGDHSATVQGDPLVLRQAFVNLIDNAVKYSPAHGAVCVEVHSANGEVWVDVRDGGPGIAPEHRAKVFDRFYRVDKARTRSEGGVGLGLSIAAWAVGAHGGQIELNCDSHPGCTFRVRLPRKRNGGSLHPSEGQRATA